jgi:hypothetical protein
VNRGGEIEPKVRGEEGVKKGYKERMETENPIHFLPSSPSLPLRFTIQYSLFITEE